MEGGLKVILFLLWIFSIKLWGRRVFTSRPASSLAELSKEQ
jgi:hypothetical protein